MPYITVRTIVNQVMSSNRQVIIDYNPGDSAFRSELSRLAASTNPGSNCSYIVHDNPFAVLGKLEDMGYKVVAANSAKWNNIEVWQTWTLHKEK